MRRLLLLISVVVLVAGSAAAAEPGPNSHTQPFLDGCQRTNAVITLIPNEWVYVNRAQVLAARLAGDRTAGRATVQGVVRDMHPAGDDEFIAHDYNDIDTDVAVDPQYLKYVSTGNGDDEIGTEWEEARVPTWAWPQIGDRVEESGSWIWDCGHWGNGSADPTPGGLAEFIPGDPVETIPDLVSGGKTIHGESTELHPLYELATFRAHAAGLLGKGKSGQVLSRLDAWISGDGTPALSEEECDLLGLPPAAIVALGTSVCSRYQDVGGTYSYTMHLGPKPTTGSKIVVNDLIVHPETDADLAKAALSLVKITLHPEDGTVGVRFTLPHRASPPVHFGISVEAGWTHGAAAVHHLVTIDGLHINATLDGNSEPSLYPGGTALGDNRPKEIAPDPGEWVMFAAANGHWLQVAPGLQSVQGDHFNQVKTGDQFNNVLRFDYWLPAGVETTLLISGRECDIPLMDCTKDRYGAPVTDLSNPFHELGFNDKPGRIEDRTQTDANYPLVIPADGQPHVYAPRVNPSSTSSDERFSDHSCGGPCYTVTVTTT